MSIITLTCPVCNHKITVEQFEANLRMLKHHETSHPKVAQLIMDRIMEIGKLKDKIDDIVEETKRVSGYKIAH